MANFKKLWKCLETAKSTVQSFKPSFKRLYVQKIVNKPTNSARLCLEAIIKIMTNNPLGVLSISHALTRAREPPQPEWKSTIPRPQRRSRREPHDQGRTQLVGSRRDSTHPAQTPALWASLPQKGTAAASESFCVYKPSNCAFIQTLSMSGLIWRNGLFLFNLDSNTQQLIRGRPRCAVTWRWNRQTKHSRTTPPLASPLSFCWQRLITLVTRVHPQYLRLHNS